MKNYKIFPLLIVMLFLSCAQKKNKTYSSALDESDIKNVVNDVIRWQIKEFPKMNDRRPIWKSENDIVWNNAVFYYALAEWSDYDPNPSVIDWYEKIAKTNYWMPNYTNSIYHADDVAICLLYAKLYEKYKNPDIIYPSVARLEFIANHNSTASLNRKTPKPYERWSWCDALYMAPPVYTRFANITHNKKLIEFMDREYWITNAYLFDKEERLYYRDSDYFGKREKNGQKVFWGRGNAWVVAGLALLIPQLPAEMKPKYVALFQTMMDRIVPLQDREGYWHPSLLDYQTYPYPETSSTGYLTYAVWWGINNNLLDKDKFLPFARKGWEALVKAVQPDGMIGWVQPVGQDPQHITSEMTETYGAAAFTLAGKEVINYLRLHTQKQ